MDKIEDDLRNKQAKKKTKYKEILTDDNKGDQRVVHLRTAKWSK